jgi:DNA mismatch endonuclease (patch repair protein)
MWFSDDTWSMLGLAQLPGKFCGTKMTDIVSAEKRSAMMAGIKGKNTKPEMTVRKALFAQGFRFRLHYKKLPGNPDIVLPKHQVAIFVHGCFWHMHSNCKLSKIPSSRPEFWISKLKANASRDKQATSQLLQLGWRVLVIWECHLKSTANVERLQISLSNWIRGQSAYGVMSELPDS